MDKKELERLIKKHDKLYYEKSAPIISDYEYDKLKSQLKDLENAGFVKPAKGFKKVKHKEPMLSLTNAFSKQDLFDFIDRIQSYLATNNATFQFVAEPKIDGLSFSAVYEDGNLISGATRGDGIIGENVTTNLLAIAGFPKYIEYADRLEVRGEVYMTKQNFFKLNEAQRFAGDDPFANPRNAASGSLRQLNPEITRARNLNYYVYAGFCDGVNTHMQMLEKLKALGFHVYSDIEIIDDTNQMLDYHTKYDEMRSSLDFDIDGVVFKINDYDIQNRLGVVGRTPRWALAYKFSGVQAHTKLLDITLQVGRTGVITPVAELEPVNIGGVEVARATLHNEDNITSKDLRVGDTVLVERAGDVIPQVVSSISHIEGSLAFVMPNNCPACGSALVRVPGEAQYRCLNDNGCLPQRIEKLRHFVSKEAFNIEGFGIKQIEIFFERAVVVTFSDIFTIESRGFADTIRKWKGFGDRSVTELLRSIDAARNVTLARFIYALGIRHVGEKTAQIIARNITNITDLFNIEAIHDLSQLDGIGEVTIEALLSYFGALSNTQEVTALLREVKITKEEVLEGGKLSGENIVFTGTLTSMSRAQAKDIAERHGATVSSSITNSVTLVVAGSDAGSKLKEAAKRNIRVIDESAWNILIS